MIRKGEAMGIHDEVDLRRWTERFPLEALHDALGRASAADWRYAQPSSVDSPSRLAHNLRLRELAGQPTEPTVAVDVLLPTLGEPSHPAASKICGLPYRPDGDWPTDSAGRPLLFLAQLCLADSRDLLPFRPPGDVLLIFCEDSDNVWIWREGEGCQLRFEWRDLGIPASELIRPERCPRNLFTPTSFERMRSRESVGDHGAVSLLKTGGKEIEVCGHWHASKIGGVPLWQQSKEEADGLGVFFAALDAINPGGPEYPFPNLPVASWQHPHSQNFFMFGDCGTVYLFWDGARVRWLMQCG